MGGPAESGAKAVAGGGMAGKRMLDVPEASFASSLMQPQPVTPAVTANLGNLFQPGFNQGGASLFGVGDSPSVGSAGVGFAFSPKIAGQVGMDLMKQQREQQQQQPQFAPRPVVEDAPQVAQFNSMAQSMPSGAQAAILKRLGLLGAM